MRKPDAVGYENSDVIVRTARWWAAYLAVFCLVSAGLCVLLYSVLDPHAFHGSRANGAMRRIPGPPLLQDDSTARTDIRSLRRYEDHILTTSGPSIENPGARRIPVETAINILARQGLPNHLGTPAPPPQPLPQLPQYSGGQP